MVDASFHFGVECVDDAVAEALRRLTPLQSIAAIADANDMARLLAAAGIRRLHSDWSESEVQAEVARRMLDAAD
jgi:hypothetical protein